MKKEDFYDLMLHQKSNESIFFGDWHGDMLFALESLERVYEKYPAIDVYYHVGDFGLWPNQPYYLDEVGASLKAAGKIMVVTGGNHEDWDTWDEWTKNGTPYNYENTGLILLPKFFAWTQKDVSFISVGGASSIDQNFRYPGTSWWPQEVIDEKLVDRITSMDALTTDVLITHESSDDPVDSIVRVLNDPLKQAVWQQYCIEESDKQRMLVSRIVEHVKPTTHVHGHWHLPEKRIKDGLHTVSLGDNRSSYAENSYVLESL